MRRWRWRSSRWRGPWSTTFGTAGKTVISFGRSVEIKADVAVNPVNGLIYVVGSTADGTIDLSPRNSHWAEGAGATVADFEAARFMPSGMLSTPQFNGTGMVTRDFSGGLDGASGVAVQADGKVIIAGGTEVIATRKVQLRLLPVQHGWLDRPHLRQWRRRGDGPGRERRRARFASTRMGRSTSSATPRGTTATTSSSSASSTTARHRCRSWRSATPSASNVHGRRRPDVHGSAVDVQPDAGHGPLRDSRRHRPLPGAQYDATSGDLTFAPGVVRETFTVH